MRQPYRHVGFVPKTAAIPFQAPEQTGSLITSPQEGRAEVL